MIIEICRAGNFLFNSLVPSDKCYVYFTCPEHKTTCPKKSATAIQGLKNSLFISTMSQLSEKLKSKKKRKFIFKALSYKIRKKMIYLSKVMQRQSSATYLSNRTTWIIFFLVRMEKLPVSDVRTDQVSFHGYGPQSKDLHFNVINCGSSQKREYQKLGVTPYSVPLLDHLLPFAFGNFGMDSKERVINYRRSASPLHI